MPSSPAIERCPWAQSTEIYRRYHDEEWGIPVYDDRDLFEKLILEGAQAGLSWITILNKREGYQRAFDGFEPSIIAQYDDAKVASLMVDPGIVRNRLKILAAITNAQAYLRFQEEPGGFSTFLWQFVDGKPTINHWSSTSQVPASTSASDAMSTALKKPGFKFVGSTICYAFMQAVGMVNDHLVACPRHAAVIKADSKSKLKRGSRK